MKYTDSLFIRLFRLPLLLSCLSPSEAAFIQHGGALKLNQARPAVGRLRAPLYAKQEDKWDILSSFGRKPRDLDEEGIVSAWDKLSRRSVTEGPRKGHLPPLHADYRFHALLGRTATISPQLTPSQLATILTSLAKLRFRPDDATLQAMVDACVADRSHDLCFGSSARILTAMTRLDHHWVDLTSLTHLIDGLSLPTRRSGDAEGVAAALWWLMVSGAYRVYPECVEALLVRANNELRVWDYAGEPSGARGQQRLRVCRQLGLVLKYPIESEAGEDLRGRVETALDSLGQWKDPAKASRLQDEVLSAAMDHGAVCEPEWSDGVVSIDFVLAARRSDALPVAVEVDGPSHFFVNDRKRPTGLTLCKVKTLLEAYNGSWATVISVPHWDWPRKDPKAQGRFLWRKLKEAGLDPTTYIDAPTK